MPYHVIQGGRRKRRRRRGPLLLFALTVVAALAIALAARGGGGGPRGPAAADADAALPPSSALLDSGTAPLEGGGGVPSPLAVRLDGGADPVRPRFRDPPRAGLLFDVRSGEVLWRRNPTRLLPIASLTKMMTALVVAERVPPGDRVRITRQALAYRGSGVGLLPLGRSIPVGTLLHGLLLPSGNDAAIALAQHAGGSVSAFVELMNRRAAAMGLECTRFSTPSGYRDRGNRSCAADLAALGRAVLREPRLRPIVGRREAVLPFPIKGGKLYLYNNNPLLRMGYRGTNGVKTGYTDAAGRCIVATVRRGSRTLGVVLLHSPDTGTQARRLLDRGFAVARTGG
jgi:D-alanyl-D-alanine carboxypeptidase (penicillin-binding protein 5/6)